MGGGDFDIGVASWTTLKREMGQSAGAGAGRRLETTGFSLGLGFGLEKWMDFSLFVWDEMPSLKVLEIQKMTKDGLSLKRHIFQISTTSGIHALSFRLNVMTPQAKILGPIGPHSDLKAPQDEVHLVKGSTISLTCSVEKASSPPQ